MENNTSDQDSGQVVASAAEVYESFFVPALFGQWPPVVLEAAEVQVGDSLLDVGCGTGVLARAAIERAGPTGRVCGVDVNTSMLDVARRSHERVQWQVASAERLPFDPASFDRVVSQFAMMFFSDRSGAVDEMARVVSPGGTVTVATWASATESPGYAAMIDLLDRLFGAAIADALSAPFSIGTAAELEAVMAGSFAGVAVTRHAGTARFNSLAEWIHTDIRGWTLAELIDDEQYAELQRAAAKELVRFVDDAGRVTFDAPALVAVARAG